MTSDTTPQKAHTDDAAQADQAAPGLAPLPLIALGDADAAVCVDGVCRLPEA
ncbi:hypothetical protein [Microbacterium sp. JZ31]|uniref:hypothetical protein n=1 Tax=Microbacterium sp. JZ31 TaxID=1906274 RepID=UPI001933B696|nr:hypothetical protein [Microbacterium sp. JZ31]